MRHYEATGRRYPLAVKLGTITPHSADVYSYAADEDDMVLDPNLARPLLGKPLLPGVRSWECTATQR